ncbi:hypothetical protein [Pseudomonas citronellolis]|uniref:hypothetical protein n=1 Tax=Pseudomonas citronellolis TaxID=53408 RepID=UPI0023E3B061|nr:hypothetical protein [Pseudomonas citronellolis]MDF3932152.1 hypothetical protein [Pseudomonas citronellolis]
MSLPMVMLGGVPIVPHAGTVSQSITPLGGPEIIRLSGGVGVPMTHWQRAAIALSGSGYMPPGLDGLDYTQPLELRCTKHLSIVSTGTSFVLAGAPRPDFAPWAFALVGGQWVEADLALAGVNAEVAPVSGATAYQVCWMPVFMVSAKRPQGDMDPSNNATPHGWQIACEEL